MNSKAGKGLPSSNRDLDFFANLQSPKSLFNRKNSKTSINRSPGSSTPSVYSMAAVEMKPQIKRNTPYFRGLDSQSSMSSSSLSSATRRILTQLDSYSRPLINTQSMSTLKELENNQQWSHHPYLMNHYSGYSTKPLQPRNPSQLLLPTKQQLLERRRLHQLTATCRNLEVESGPLWSLPNPNVNSSSTYKMRSKLSHQMRQKPDKDLEQAPPPLALPKISFPAMASLPKFDLFIKSNPAPASVPEPVVKSTARRQFTFAEPMSLEDWLNQVEKEEMEQKPLKWMSWIAACHG